MVTFAQESSVFSGPQVHRLLWIIAVCPSSAQNRWQALMEPPFAPIIGDGGRREKECFLLPTANSSFPYSALAFLQAHIAAVSAGRPTRRNSSWKLGSSRKPSMLGSI